MVVLWLIGDLLCAFCIFFFCLAVSFFVKQTPSCCTNYAKITEVGCHRYEVESPDILFKGEWWSRFKIQSVLSRIVKSCLNGLN